MSEVNFCPYCDSPSHKLMLVKEGVFFCKECDSFFQLHQIEFKCPKCNATNIGDSDFPGPAGGIVLQCKKCKKMFSAKEFLNHNNIGE